MWTLLHGSRLWPVALQKWAPQAAACAFPHLLSFYHFRRSPAAGLKVTRRKAGRTLLHRKVSVVDPPPGESGLMSTLTQATFSWLSHTRGEQRHQGLCQSIRGRTEQHTADCQCHCHQLQSEKTTWYYWVCVFQGSTHFPVSALTGMLSSFDFLRVTFRSISSSSWAKKRYAVMRTSARCVSMTPVGLKPCFYSLI